MTRGDKVTYVALMVTGLALGMFALMTLEGDHDTVAPGHDAVLHEGDQGIERIPGSTGQPIRFGECGQYRGNGSWHRIECPK